MAESVVAVADGVVVTVKVTPRLRHEGIEPAPLLHQLAKAPEAS